jgi:uncharacterized membrane protein (UPF0182 family)
MRWGLFEEGLKPIAALVGLWIGLNITVTVMAESLWFQEVGYSDVFWTRLLTRLVLTTIAVTLTGAFLVGNLIVANRLKYPHPTAPSRTPSSASRHTLSFRYFLPLVGAIALLFGLVVIYYGRDLFELWHPRTLVLPEMPPVPKVFGIEPGAGLLAQMLQSTPIFFLWLGVSAASAIFPGILWAIALALSLGFGLIFSSYWGKFLQFFHPTPFEIADPVFNHNLSFYIFSLPIWELLQFWLTGVLLAAFLSVALIYLVSGNSLSEGRFPGFCQGQLRHLNGLGGLLALAIALNYWLARYQLLYSTSSVTYGASYTDLNVVLWVDTGLSLLALAIGGFTLWKAVFWSKELEIDQFTLQNPILRFGLAYAAIVAIAGYALPVAVQRLVVQPNELARELPYIQRSIAFTRQAFNLDRIDVRTFDPEGRLSWDDIQTNHLTIDNIRLWDKRPLLLTNRQLQQIRLYYRFPDADIDRYTLLKESTRPGDPPTEKQQVIIAARELDYASVPSEAQTWINEHLVYTHGYGFTLSPVNTAGPGGLPTYYVKDIGLDSPAGNNTTLRTSSERIRASIPIGHPRIYYGTIGDTFVMAPTEVPEFDYPSGDENVSNHYDGVGGIPIASRWRQLLFAKYLNSWQMVFTRYLTPNTKLLFRRNITERIRAIAPFLKFDSDPYLAVANTRLYNSEESLSSPQVEQKNYLYWIVDAYTTSDRYPYSDPGAENFNYIRNSVKVVVDAYNGTVNFYVADPEDPIVQTWESIFPNLFKSLKSMPITLRTHIRYPVDFFSIQSERLLTYHMTDPQVFYNREDQWRVPQEIYGNEPQALEPYYLIMRFPNERSEEFIILHPFTPKGRNNLIAWLAGRSDGTDYGKLLLYQFPKQTLVYGPEQIEARINQDPVISQQISLWDRQGSRAIQGNLLVIPIEQSLLYVEPLYLEAEQNSLPILARVIVAYENRIAMAETLDKALQAIFNIDRETTRETTPPILRPLDRPDVPLNEPLLPLE